MLLLSDIRIKIISIIFVLFSSAYWSTNLPLILLIACIFGYIISRFKWPKAMLLQGLLLGVIIASLQIGYYKDVNQSLYDYGYNITIKGEIQSLIVSSKDSSSIFVQVLDINTYPIEFYRYPLVKLSISNSQKRFKPQQKEQIFKQGQIWQLTIKLRPPIGRHNEVGYKLEDYALANGIHSYGKIISASIIDDSQSYRSQWFEKVYQGTADITYQYLLLALTFGYKNDITAANWQILKNSGLAHLMAISGLHIGFVFSIGWLLGKIVRILLPSKNTRLLPIIVGCLLATFYAWLAGFSLPTVRALVACFLLSLLLVYRIKWPKHQILLWCMLIVLLISPFSFLATSFWLSFSAVCMVFISLHLYQVFINDRQATSTKKWRQMLFIQFSLFMLLAPIQGFFFSGISYLSPLINLVSIPWVSFFIVPLSLAATIMELLSSQIAQMIWQWTDWLMSPVWWLAKRAELSWLILPKYSNLVLLTLITFFVVSLFVPLRLFIHPIIALLIASLFIKPEKTWQIDFLDVGHGLSVLLSNNNATVVYDTGMKWPTGSIAQTVIEPILHHRGIVNIDGLILSHSDNDHAGGKAYLTDRFKPRWIRTSEIGDSQPCIKGQTWQEDGMNFAAIWPPSLVQRAYNPHSCVIKLSIGNWNFLLTGDIDAISEMLILNQNEFDDIDLFLVPHHGSKSSSTQRWTRIMAGKIAVVSTARFSPWALPNKEIRQRYLANQAIWLDTAQLGQITISEKNDKLLIKGYSLRNQNVWYRKLFGDNINTE